MKLHQTTQFRPTPDSITALLNLYGLKLVSFSQAASGIENCTVLITTTTGEFVLRIYRQGKKANRDILREIDFMQFLKDNRLPVAIALPNTNGERLSHLEENHTVWQAILMPHLAGRHASHYLAPLITGLAQTQAQMHQLAARYQGDAAADEIKVLKEAHFIQLIHNKASLNNDCQHFIDRADKYRVELDKKLPKGLCHLDFDNGNVLSKGNAVTAILDFDDLMLAPYVMCLAYSLWDVAFDAGLPAAALYINHYTKLRQLSGLEQQFVVKIMLFRHYVIGCKDIADNQMDSTLLRRYLQMEQELLSPQNLLFWV